MRLTWLLVLCLVVSAALAKDNNKSKRKERNRNKRVRGEREDTVTEVEVDDTDEEYKTIDVIQEGGQPTERFLNPCNNKDCKRGEVCVLEDATTAVCVCMSCDEPDADDNVVKVCSTKNITYQSECHLDRDHCLCKNNQPGCSDNRENRIRLDYYAACKELTKCPEEELELFPTRMRQWLYQVMNDMTMRGYEEMIEYRDMLESARADEQHVDAVIWKFCDLDVHPTDRHVTRRELMYIIASIKPMEHCLVPFLNNCDADDDNTISLVEWGSCLNIGHDAIIDKCKNAKQG